MIFLLGNGARWITVVSPQEPNGTELLLEPNADYPAMKTLKEALVADGIPFTAFEVDDIQAEYARLKELGVTFIMEPTNVGMSTIAAFDDTLRQSHPDLSNHRRVILMGSTHNNVLSIL